MILYQMIFLKEGEINEFIFNDFILERTHESKDILIIII
jgi:hypothetical protein